MTSSFFDFILDSSNRICECLQKSKGLQNWRRGARVQKLFFLNRNRNSRLQEACFSIPHSLVSPSILLWCLLPQHCSRNRAQARDLEKRLSLGRSALQGPSPNAPCPNKINYKYDYLAQHGPAAYYANICMCAKRAVVLWKVTCRVVVVGVTSPQSQLRLQPRWMPAR